MNNYNPLKIEKKLDKEHNNIKKLIVLINKLML